MEADADALRAAGAQAAFVGMPFDSTTIARPGAQLGPRAVRDWSSHLLSYHGEYDLDLFEALGVVDMGDVAVVPANAAKTVDLVADAMGEAIKAGAIPVLCGGEHITTIGGSMAVDRHAPDGNVRADPGRHPPRHGARRRRRADQPLLPDHPGDGARLRSTRPSASSSARTAR